jgi:hypothetical protein
MRSRRTATRGPTSVRSPMELLYGRHFSAGTKRAMAHDRSSRRSSTGCANGSRTARRLRRSTRAFVGGNRPKGRIPSRWTAGLQDLPYFISLGEGLAQIACGEAGDDARLFPFRPRLPAPDKALPDVIDSLRRRTIARDTRVQHRALGAGWVQAIHTQEVRRRGGGEIIYARVALDIGQTAQFRAHIPAPEDLPLRVGPARPDDAAGSRDAMSSASPTAVSKPPRLSASASRRSIAASSRP